MKILVRLPNWLGDMVMAAGFMQQLRILYPDSEISVIAKKGIHELLYFFPGIKEQFIFDKKSFKGLSGLWKFGRMIRKKERFDLFFSLPNSFSSALMGYATGAKKRIGYSNELRQIFLTHSFSRNEKMHRVEEYISLLEQFEKQKCKSISVTLPHTFSKKDHLVININSEAQSRRLTSDKAVEIISSVLQKTSNPVYLIGSPTEKNFVDDVEKKIHNERLINVAGTTSLSQLAELLATAKVVLTTDSGPAHLSNALGTKTVVLFGAGNEQKTSPYQKNILKVIRLNSLSCEPCEKNICVRYKEPQCLLQLNSNFIAEQVYSLINE